MELSNKWKLRFIDLANSISLWSKDSTKVGAVLVNEKNKNIISTGYNGIPRNVNENNERYIRPVKYNYAAHAEENVICNLISVYNTDSSIVLFKNPSYQEVRMIINIGYTCVIIINDIGISNDKLEMFKEANVAVENIHTNNKDINTDKTIIHLTSKCSKYVKDSVLFVTHFPCYECAVLIVYSGIKKIIYNPSNKTNMSEETFEKALKVFKENNVVLEEFKL